LRTCVFLEGGSVHSLCYSTPTLWRREILTELALALSHGRPSTRGRGLPTPRIGPNLGMHLMTTDPLQQLLDDVSMAMNYARAGLIEQGYMLLIERCALSAPRNVDTRSRYRSVIQSFERRWKIRYH
jgi:hypothetical protein